MTLSLLLETLWNRDGLWWYEAPKPSRIHRHVPWTTCQTAEGYEIWRCACGAMRWTDIPGWIDELEPRVTDEPVRKPRAWWNLFAW